MKLILLFIGWLIPCLWAYAESDGARPSSLSVYKMAIIDVNAIRRDSLLLRSMYDEANKLSENLQYIAEKFQEDSLMKWEALNANSAKLSEKEKEEALEQHKLLVEAKERFIVSRRIAIENAVADIDNQIKTDLLDNIIAAYAEQHDIDVVLRKNQLVYNRIPDITKDILDILNKKEIKIGLGLESLVFEDVMMQLNSQIKRQMSSPSVVN